MPFFQPATPLTVSEDDGIVIYGRRSVPRPETAPRAIPPVQGNWPQRVRKELNRIARLINGPPEPARQSVPPFYHGHASGLRIAGIACVHRAPQG